MTTIYLSGCDTRRDIQPAYKVGHRNLLTSFIHHGRNKKTNAIESWKTDFPGLRLFVDSGGFTLRDDPTHLASMGKTLETYADEYIDFLYKNHKNIHIAANLDLYDTAPQLSRSIDEKLKEFEIETGTLVCYVYHPSLGVGTFERMCMQHRLVGIARDTLESPACNVSVMLTIARRLGALVHGFGITESEIITNETFYSVDSTTWKSGARYGNVAIFNKDRITTYDINNLPKILPHKEKFKSRHVDWSLIEDHIEGSRSKEITNELLSLHAATWLDYQEYITDRTTARAWWRKVNAIGKDIKPSKAGHTELKEWCDHIGYPFLASDHAKLRQEVALVIALARFDVQSLEDYDFAEIIAFAQAHLPAEVDGLNDDDTIFSAIRTAMLELFVPLESVKPVERNDEQESTSNNKPQERQQAELDDLEQHGKEIEKQEMQYLMEEEEKEQIAADSAEGLAEDNDKDCPKLTIEKPDFLKDLQDETLESRALLLFDAMVRVNKAKFTIRVLSMKRSTQAILKRKEVCKGRIAAGRQEIAFLKKRLPVRFVKRLASYVEDRTKHTSNTLVAQETEKGNLPAKRKRGAPKGNANAMKHGLYSRKAPGLACNSCPIASKCYMFREDHVCAFEKDFRKDKITSIDDAQDLMRRLTEEDLSRLQKALIFETATGSVSETTTRHLATVFDRLNKLKEGMLLDQQDEQEKQMTIRETRTVSGPKEALAALFAQAAASGINNNNPAEDDDQERQKVIEAERIE